MLLTKMGVELLTMEKSGWKKDFDCLENDFAPRDIVVDLFRMAEIDQNEDLVMACVTDIRLDLPSIGEAVNSHS